MEDRLSSRGGIKKYTYMSICSRYSLINRWWTVLWSYNEKVLHPHLPIYPSKWVYLVHHDSESIRLMNSSCSQAWPYIYAAKFTSIHADSTVIFWLIDDLNQYHYHKINNTSSSSSPSSPTPHFVDIWVCVRMWRQLNKKLGTWSHTFSSYQFNSIFYK